MLRELSERHRVLSTVYAVWPFFRKIGEDQLSRWLGTSLIRIFSRATALVFALLLLATSLLVPAASVAQTDTSVAQADARMFAQTGYRVDRDAFYDYFTHRGGVTTFGYPVSRDFLFQ